MEIRRGDVVTVAMQGDYGKPRPALVVQANAFQMLDSVTVLRLSSDLRDLPLFRITVDPRPNNGLQRRSQVMVDKAATVPRAKIGQRIGRADAGTMRAVDSALAGFLGLH
jgi:mRNA interferase MazF